MAGGAPGDDLVAEPRRPDRLRHTGEERRAEAVRERPEERVDRRGRERSAEADDVLRPQHDVERSREAARLVQGGSEDRAGRHLELVEPTPAPALDERGAHVADRRTAVGRERRRSRARRHEDQRAAPGERPAEVALGEPRRQRADAGPGEEDPGGDEQGATRSGQGEQRPAGLTERGAAERHAAEGPGVPHPLGQRQRPGERQEPAATRRHDGAGERGEHRLHGDEPDVARRRERQRPGAPDGELRDPGDEPDERPRPRAAPREQHREEAHPGGTEGPDAEGRHGRGDERPGRQREPGPRKGPSGDVASGHGAPGVQAGAPGHCSSAAAMVAAARSPLATQAGMPMPP